MNNNTKQICMRLVIIYLLIFAFKAKSAAQSSFSVNVAINDCGPSVIKYLNSNNIGIAHTIYGKDIYPNDPYEVNSTTLINAIIKAFPSRNSTGMGILDWEGEAFNSLAYKSAVNPNFKKAINSFTKALKIAKSVRPNVKWGFYGIPFRRAMYKSDGSWSQQNTNIGSLLSQCGAFYPNFYRVSNIKTENLHAGALRVSQSAIEKYAELALSLGAKYKKPVYCFVWHRYMGHDPRYRDHQLSEDEFMRTINEIKKANVNGNKISGIIWWSWDTYFYKRKNKVISKEAPNLQIFKSNYDNMVINYLRKIKSSK